MAMSDLLWTKPRLVGGVLLAPPTVRSFFRALEVFGEEIGAVREARSRIDEPLSAEAMLAPFLAHLEDGRLDYVLEGILQEWTGGGFRPEDELARSVRAVVIALGKNLPRLDELLGEPSIEISEETADGDDVLYILGCADRYHLDPRVVLDWPIGLFLDVIDAGTRSTEGKREQEASGRPIEQLLGSMIPTIQKEAVPDNG